MRSFVQYACVTAAAMAMSSGAAGQQSPFANGSYSDLMIGILLAPSSTWLGSSHRVRRWRQSPAALDQQTKNSF